jgi:hypothetical protein
MIDVQLTVGAPTAGRLTAKVQKRLPHRTGNMQYTGQRLVDLSTEEKATWLVEGGWPARMPPTSSAQPSPTAAPCGTSAPG